LITGCSPDGLGASAATSIAAHNPNLLILAGRSRPKIELTEAALKARFPAVNTKILELDLASFASVRKAADEVNSYNEVLNVLINNAAIMGTPFTKTVDGIESNFATNHLGPFLFTNLLLERMLQSGKTLRIVNISSSAYRLGAIRYEDVNFEVFLFLDHFYLLCSHRLLFSCVRTLTLIIFRTKNSRCGRHTADPSLQIFSFLRVWSIALEQRACNHLACIREVRNGIAIMFHSLTANNFHK
jgi:hypothetical protein